MRPGADTSSGGDLTAGGRDRWQHRWDQRWAQVDERSGQGAWRGGRGIRLWLPVIVSTIVQVPFAVWLLAASLSAASSSEPDHRFPGLGPRFDTDPTVAAVGLALALIGPLALIAARRYPGPVVAVVVVAASVDLLLPSEPSGPPFVALAFAILSAVVRGRRVWAWISIAAAWVLTVVIGSILDVDRGPAAIAGITFGILVVLGVGESIRSRRDRFEQASRAAVSRRQTAVEAERVRIARELHDVLAHSLSQINVQASVGLHLADAHPEKAVEALANIKESSKTALDEVRSVLGVLRSGEAEVALVPEPDLSRISALVASMSSTGIAVALDDDLTVRESASSAGRGHPELPAAIQSAAYRIVQESLTNVVRHSRASNARVWLRREGTQLVVSVSDDGRGGVIGDGGRGLLGMRERAELLGGTLTVDSSSAGVAVRAALPAWATAAADAPARETTAADVPPQVAGGPSAGAGGPA